MPQVKPGTVVYRNYDQEFEKALSKESAIRKIGVDILFEETEQGYRLSFTDVDGNMSVVESEWKKEDARTPQQANIRNQLSKLGTTRFDVTGVEIRMNGERFIPSSLLSDMRRNAAEKLENLRLESYSRPNPGKVKETSAKYPSANLTYLGNVMNAQARTFYQDHGVVRIDDAFEKNQPDKATIMFCRHCIKYALGLCAKRDNSSKRLQISEPLYLRSSDGRQFALRFDCSRCQMEVQKDNSSD
jgi:putative protease